MLDFNNEQEQQTRNYGPVPAGSKVLVRLTIRQPKYPAAGLEMVARSQKGLLHLDAGYEVIAGTYEGVKWFEMLWLPTGHQREVLTDGQATACIIAGRKMRAMIEASKGIMPKDDSDRAKRGRTVGSWLDFNGLEFPIVTAIDDRPYEKNGKRYWNNIISSILTPDNKDYDFIKNGGEIISDGPVAGETKSNRQTSSNSDPGYETPPAYAYDDGVPF